MDDIRRKAEEDLAIAILDEWLQWDSHELRGTPAPNVSVKQGAILRTIIANRFSAALRQARLEENLACEEAILADSGHYIVAKCCAHLIAKRREGE